MKLLAAMGVLFFVPVCAHAQAAKTCEDLKTEIAAKLDAKGVKSYTLDIVAKDDTATEGKVVGTCGGGTKKIMYKRGEAAPAEKPATTPAKEPTKP
jgi:Protein of unknown function (DUF1161)